MKFSSVFNVPPLFVEFGPAWLKARCENDSVEVPIERGPDGKMTLAGKEKVIATLKSFLQAKSWMPRARAWCAINSRGVSLRRLSIPGGPREEFQQRLLLQIESEFPVAPEELAWGSQIVGQSQSAHGAPPRQELLVAAVKKDQIADYDEILRESGAEPIFVLAAMARSQFVGRRENAFALLDIGPELSELTLFENSLPTSSRIIFWSGKNVTASENAPLEELARSIRHGVSGKDIYVSGSGVSADFARRLSQVLANGSRCDALEATPKDSTSAAISGLQMLAGQNGSPALVLQAGHTRGDAGKLADFEWKKWAARTGLLVAALLILPYAEALLLKPHLEHKVTVFKEQAARLTVIDRELDFLQGLKLNQPPYLDLLYVLSKSVPPGTRFDSLSLNSHGQMALRTAFHDGQQVDAFRDKLLASGFFTNVVVEEQVPTPDHQRVTVRISATENSAVQLQVAAAKLVVADDGKDGRKTTASGNPASLPPGPPMLRKESK